jgi:hypothetical protein
MLKKQAVPVALGVVFLLALGASTAFADAVHSDKLANLNAYEQQPLFLPEIARAEESYLFASIQANNGKQLGFSATAVHRGPQLGIVRPNGPTVTQNPEPATMILLGTGLAAVGAIIRRRLKV